MSTLLVARLLVLVPQASSLKSIFKFLQGLEAEFYRQGHVVKCSTRQSNIKAFQVFTSFPHAA